MFSVYEVTPYFRVTQKRTHPLYDRACILYSVIFILLSIQKYDEVRQMLLCRSHECDVKPPAPYYCVWMGPGPTHRPVWCDWSRFRHNTASEQ